MSAGFITVTHPAAVPLPEELPEELPLPDELLLPLEELPLPDELALPDELLPPDEPPVPDELAPPEEVLPPDDAPLPLPDELVIGENPMFGLGELFAHAPAEPTAAPKQPMSERAARCVFLFDPSKTAMGTP